jgi:hypothetical protein
MGSCTVQRQDAAAAAGDVLLHAQKLPNWSSQKQSVGLSSCSCKTPAQQLLLPPGLPRRCCWCPCLPWLPHPAPQLRQGCSGRQPPRTRPQQASLQQRCAAAGRQQGQLVSTLQRGGCPVVRNPGTPAGPPGCASRHCSSSTPHSHSAPAPDPSATVPGMGLARGRPCASALSSRSTTSRPSVTVQLWPPGSRARTCRARKRTQVLLRVAGAWSWGCSTMSRCAAALHMLCCPALSAALAWQRAPGPHLVARPVPGLVRRGVPVDAAVAVDACLCRPPSACLRLQAVLQQLRQRHAHCDRLLAALLLVLAAEHLGAGGAGAGGAGAGGAGGAAHRGASQQGRAAGRSVGPPALPTHKCAPRCAAARCCARASRPAAAPAAATSSCSSSIQQHPHRCASSPKAPTWMSSGSLVSKGLGARKR